MVLPCMANMEFGHVPHVSFFNPSFKLKTSIKFYHAPSIEVHTVVEAKGRPHLKT